MILLEGAFFIIISFVSIISFAGLGQFLSDNENKNFFINVFYGFFITTFLITFVHFFTEINIYISSIILFIGFILALKNLNILNKKGRKDLTNYFIIFLILIPIYITQKYHEDFGYYHLPYIINMVSEKIIFGLGNVNRAFIHNSIWLNIISFFYIKDNINFVTLPTFLIYSVFIIFSVHQILKNKEKKLSSFFLILIIFYLILKFTRISEFGNDIPAVVFSSLSIYYFLRFSEEDGLGRKKIFFFNNLSFAIFAILIKFSSIPIILISFYIFLKNYKILNKEIFKFNYLFIYCLGLIFFIQQVIYTGCFIFPSEITCLDVSWFDQNSLNSKNRLELVNKGYFSSSAKNLISAEEYLRNFNWIPFWFEKTSVGILEHTATMISPLILFFIFLKKDKNNIKSSLKDIIFFIFFILIGFIFWFKFSPVYRFAIIYFLSLIFLSTFFIYKKKIFSKNVFLSFIFLFLFFNFTKNILRISNEERVFFGIKKIENSFISNKISKNSLIPIYQPDKKANEKKGNGWQSRLCWDIKFLCTKNKIEITKKNNYLIIKKLPK